MLTWLQQYYKGKDKKWEYMPVVGFAKAFQETQIAKKARAGLQQPYKPSNPKCDEILIKDKYALNGRQHVEYISRSSSIAASCASHLVKLVVLQRDRVQTVTCPFSAHALCVNSSIAQARQSRVDSVADRVPRPTRLVLLLLCKMGGT